MLFKKINKKHKQPSEPLIFIWEVLFFQLFIFMRKHVTKAIYETIIGESFESKKEIKELALDVLRELSKIYFYNLNADKGSEYGSAYLAEGSINFLIKDKSKYQSLGDFSSSIRFRVKLVAFDSKSAMAYYERISGNIIVYVSTDTAKRIQKMFDDGEMTDHFSIYSILYHEIYTYLLHEIQHAYDEHRSKGKAYNTKEYNRYLSKYPSSQKNLSTPQEKADFENERIKNYLNLPHEVWARFSQAFADLRFFKREYINNMQGVKLNMVPLNKILEDFKYRYHGWDRTQPKYQKKMINRIVAYWNKYNDSIKDIEKAETIKHKEQLQSF